MNAFIQKNKKLLKFYYTALRLSGWSLLSLGVFSIPISLIFVRFLDPKSIGAISIMAPLRTSNLILFGILGLGIAQLIRYLSERKSKRGFLLRHVNKFLYIYVLLAFIVMVMGNVYAIKYMLYGDVVTSQPLFISTLITSFVLFAAKALILVGVAQFIKRLIPIIEEHKTLV